MKFREITAADIPALFAVRTATDENCLSPEQLTALGITPDSVAAKLRDSHAGWLCEDGTEAILMKSVEDWLWSEGCSDPFGLRQMTTRASVPTRSTGVGTGRISEFATESAP